MKGIVQETSNPRDSGWILCECVKDSYYEVKDTRTETAVTSQRVKLIEFRTKFVIACLERWGSQVPRAVSYSGGGSGHSVRRRRREFSETVWRGEG
jgi:hypothetical protein